MTATKLYHPLHAPEGQTFENNLRQMEMCAQDGWVDDPAKIGVNPWGASHDDAVREKHTRYLSGKERGIESGDGQSIIDCKIWHTVASKGVTVHDGIISIYSPRAGGEYLVNESDLLELDLNDERLKARLTTLLVQQRQFGNPCPELSASLVSQALQSHNMVVQRRADRLLQYIHSLTDEIGEAVRFNYQNILCTAMAWSESVSVEEVEFLLDYIVDRSWLDRNEEATTKSYIITVNGYERIDELKSVNTVSSQAFVAMWMNNSLDDAWEQGIEPGIRDAGYEPMRIDRKEHNDKIDDQIIAEIRRSRFVVADFTQGQDGARGGVYFEAGFAKGLGIDVIFTCRQDLHDLIHFDTRQYNHIFWQQPVELRKKLADRISATVGDGPQKES